jgi:hypothetical protein
MRTFPRASAHDTPLMNRATNCRPPLKPLVQCKVIQAQELLDARVHPAQGGKD